MEWFREELRILGLLKGRVEDLGWLRGELRIWIVNGRVEDLTTGNNVDDYAVIAL